MVMEGKRIDDNNGIGFQLRENSNKVNIKRIKKILPLLIIILILTLFSEYNANETQKLLDAKEEEIDEKIKIAKEAKRIQDSLKFSKIQ